MRNIEGFILTGGASSRMGTDKAHLRLGSQTFVEKIARALSSITTRISVVSPVARSAPGGFPVVSDIHENCGALGGLHAALARARADWIGVVSCDLPFVTGALFERLAGFIPAEGDAVAPVQADGRPQPLCALYRREPCLEMAEAALGAGELRPRVLLEQARTRWVAFVELADLPHSQLFFRNINTPADYLSAQAEYEALAPLAR